MAIISAFDTRPVITPSSTDGRHALHSRARIWPESNCYLDAWIGILHSLDLDPVPMLLATLDSRFEFDQWTFCKPSAFELATLYGVRVEELNIWRSVQEHVERQVVGGRIVLLETDGFHLPDTSGTTYQRSHGKTTIAITRMNVEARELHYLHNTTAGVLSGTDFDGVFAAGVTSAALPPFAEFVDVSQAAILDLTTLRDRVVMLAQARVARGAASDAALNPFTVWMASSEEHMNDLSVHDIEHFHTWAFATVRQAGAASDLLSRWCRWMGSTDQWLRAATFFEELARAMAAQQFRLARVPGGGRRPDFAAVLEQCAPLWSEAHMLVRAALDPASGTSRTTAWRSSTRSLGY